MDADDDYPSEINEDLKWFNETVENVEETMKPLLNTARTVLTREMDSMEMIKLDLATAFTVNSLFWSYLVLQGVDPKTHPIKQELDRVQSYMAKIKEIEDKKKAPRLAKDAAKRFVRNAMFDLKEKNSQRAKQREASEDADVELEDDDEVVTEPTPDGDGEAVENQADPTPAVEDSSRKKGKKKEKKENKKKRKNKSKKSESRKKPRRSSDGPEEGEIDET